MIRGRFIEDRPFLRAEVVVPAEDRAGRVRTHTASLDFQVDTGSDVTTIARADFERLLGLSLTQAQRGAQSVGIGAAVPSRIIWAYLFFDDEHGGRCVAATTLVILETEPHEQMHSRSVLGLDVLLLGRLSLERDSVSLDLPIAEPAG